MRDDSAVLFFCGRPSWASARTSSPAVTMRDYSLCLLIFDPGGSPSRGGDVTVYVFYMNQPSLPTPFYSVLVSSSVLRSFELYFIP